MCGIAGIVSMRGKASPEEIDLMTRTVEHRGPDDHGYLGYDSAMRKASFTRDASELGGGCDLLLGHRRLSIIDLSEFGRCPMPYDHGKLWIIHNGEVYNYIELRDQLKGLGHRFTTSTDTEVILAAYKEWGTECLHRFNGMWAFALLDIEKSILFCARDRLGVKPFYYSWDGVTFSFGSEIKQLIACSRVSREPHSGVLFDFFAFNTFGCNSEQTFYKEVLDMRGGHYLIVPIGATDRWNPLPVRWWDIDLRNKTHGWTDKQYANRYLELFEDSVRLRLRSDVPLGTCLSGGLDSTGIVCMVDNLLLKAGSSGLQKTFTATSDNRVYNEREYAQAVIDATHVDPSFVLPTANRLLQEMDDLIWHQDEPFISTSIFAGWCVYALAKEQGVTVTLDGQGPDEMLGGYLPFMYSALIVDNATKLALGSMVRNLLGVHRTLAISYSKIAVDSLRESGKRVLGSFRVPSLEKSRSFLDPVFFEEGMEHSVFLKDRESIREWRRQIGGNGFDQLLYRYTKHDSLPGILRQVDRNAMAHSVEARLPFLDYRLVEYTFSLPDEQKVSRGVSKEVYRRALSGIIPDKIRDRKSKLGFVTAEPDWLRGGARGLFEETFRQIPDDAPYRRDVVKKRFDQFLRGETEFDSFHWRAFCAENWFKKNVRSS